MQASFARPSVGGAVKASFIALPTSPIRAFFLARGFTLTAKVAPAGVSRIGITNYNSTTDRRGPVTLRLCGNYLLGLSPKIAVPTRTQVEPSSIATSKSCDIPIESLRMSTEGSPSAAT